MRRALFHLFMFCLFGTLAAAQTTPPASNTEMKTIFDADQTDRETKPIDWSTVAPADAKRRTRTHALLEQGQLHTADAFYEAAFIYQHGDTADSYLLAHILAMVAVTKGNKDAIWIAAATLDRYLFAVGQKQVLGTQYHRPNAGDPWTQEPYDRALISDALRQELHVESQSKQAEFLKELQGQK